jgi:hypothetical protein
MPDVWRSRYVLAKMRGFYTDAKGNIITPEMARQTHLDNLRTVRNAAAQANLQDATAAEENIGALRDYMGNAKIDNAYGRAAMLIEAGRSSAAGKLPGYAEQYAKKTPGKNGTLFDDIQIAMEGKTEAQRKKILRDAAEEITDIAVAKAK